MTEIRLFVPPPLARGATIAASPGQAHYLAAVMRRAIGDTVLLFDGRTGEWRARISGLSRKAAMLTVEEQTRPQAPESDLWLLAPVLKRETTEWMVEKATELGVARIVLTTSAQSAVTRTNPDRLAAIATEAAEQCGRLGVPEVVPPAPVARVLAGWPPRRHLLLADESRAAPPAHAVIAGAAAGAWALLVGPEGGFTEHELDGFRKLPFCLPASLGPRILRAETAAVIGLGLIQALAGDWQDRPGGRPHDAATCEGKSEDVRSVGG
ncbi:16S rRNA (uracil(1498)-N(3))-methyltransferase [Elioraea sp.]|jgi:16S rRNA (uracil1498-N3)-methyltransferase|uniref:16S rRNA (uracil(1498)-N(3))-methyltransferase n=1 Tax=Elioraea sp. TaxID=2185103 RepID=UPI0021DBAB2A|nr:16S rRNA (uracil(1498)-N(3))-methyltransferase [Elioraea sp.]GIX10064.1 MAG: ribosomal RNA small subunit methyltransferase E [Elioraea sp.]